MPPWHKRAVALLVTGGLVFGGLGAAAASDGEDRIVASESAPVLEIEGGAEQVVTPNAEEEPISVYTLNEVFSHLGSESAAVVARTLVRETAKSVSGDVYRAFQEASAEAPDEVRAELEAAQKAFREDVKTARLQAEQDIAALRRQGASGQAFAETTATALGHLITLKAEALLQIEEILGTEPGDEEPGDEEPGDEPGDEEPGDEPGDEEPGDEPGDEEPGDEPGDEEPGDEPGDEEPGDEPGDEEPGDEPGDEEPGDEPGDEEPGDEPGDEEPGDEPGDEEPGDEPGDEEPGDEPGDEEPGDEPGDEEPGDDENASLRDRLVAAYQRLVDAYHNLVKIYFGAYLSADTR